MLWKYKRKLFYKKRFIGIRFTSIKREYRVSFLNNAKLWFIVVKQVYQSCSQTQEKMGLESNGGGAAVGKILQTLCHFPLKLANKLHMSLSSNFYFFVGHKRHQKIELSSLIIKDFTDEWACEGEFFNLSYLFQNKENLRGKKEDFDQNLWCNTISFFSLWTGVMMSILLVSWGWGSFLMKLAGLSHIRAQ